MFAENAINDALNQSHILWYFILWIC